MCFAGATAMHTRMLGGDHRFALVSAPSDILKKIKEPLGATGAWGGNTLATSLKNYNGHQEWCLSRGGFGNESPELCRHAGYGARTTEDWFKVWKTLVRDFMKDNPRAELLTVGEGSSLSKGNIITIFSCTDIV